MLCGRFSSRGATQAGTVWVPGRYTYRSRGAATWGRSTISRAAALPSIGSTLYLPASTYHWAIISMSRSRCWSARLWFSVGSSARWYSSQWCASSPARSSAVIGTPNPWPASAKDGPGHGHTARQPLWSMARCPSISKYCVPCRPGASASANVCAKLTPCSGDWVTPRIVSGGSAPSVLRQKSCG